MKFDNRCMINFDQNKIYRLRYNGRKGSFFSYFKEQNTEIGLYFATFMTCCMIVINFILGMNGLHTVLSTITSVINDGRTLFVFLH